MADGDREYRWPIIAGADKKIVHVALPAPAYIANFFAWVDALISDEALFVSEGEYPESFIPTCQMIMRRMVRVYSHIINHHWDEVVKNGERRSIKLHYKEFILFAREHNMFDRSMEILYDELSKL